MNDPKSRGGPLTGLLGRAVKAVREGVPGLSDAASRGDWTGDLRRLYERTSEQFLEKTEETKRTVKLRMAILDIEHHLNRLYPDIGKMACDLWKAGDTPLRDNAELRSKVELVWEYLERREELRAQMQSLHDEKQGG